ncbi:3'-5' exonuclease [Neiella marina]|uniref:3'-5' exonuclease n=1 Tax=Neiella holothuriorum TaxID=2870530 RepID=A0ABS7EEZ2_9GAMM|nr:exonuclease domain-containing protein [Neiella holothuriorum]MBW8190493.1 3'-5' exonuclease [Neiella holothuriorum]
MWLQLKLKRQLRKARRCLNIRPNLIIANYLAALPSDFSRPISQQPMLAADLELTGLNPKHHQIVSAGFVVMDNLTVAAGKALQRLVKIDGGVGDSATIHHLTDADLASALPLTQVLEQLLEALTGRVLVCHHAPLDTAFLQQAFQQCFGMHIPLLVIDTQTIEKRIQERAAPMVPLHRLRLHHCRANYGLPVASGHQALTDAIACAELLMAQQAHQTRVSTLGDVVQLA